MSSSPADHEPRPTVTNDHFQIKCTCGYKTPIFTKTVTDDRVEERPKKPGEAWKLYRQHWTKATGTTAMPKKERKQKNQPLQEERLFDYE